MFSAELKHLLDEYGHFVYRVTHSFPKDEMFGITSQLRRASLSVALNCIEGYARRRPTVYKQFLEIAFGSLKESRYLLEFSHKENYLSEENFSHAIQLADRLGAILWSSLRRLGPNGER